MPEPRVAVYEFIASGGWHDVYGEPPPESLAIEGRAMLAALAADFAAAGCATVVLVAGDGERSISNRKSQISDLKSPISNLESDIPNLESQISHLKSGTPGRPEIVPVSPGEERASLAAAARRADWTVVIAPEFDGLLATRSDWVRAAGRLLGPAAAAIELAADKVALGEHWQAAGVHSAPGRLIRAGEPLPKPDEFAYPAVCKPRYGCGSQDVRLVRGEEPADHRVWQPMDIDRRLERFCPGQDVSVALLCGPQRIVPLPACRQHLAVDGSFAYLGGETPLPAPLNERAARLAVKAVASVRAAPDDWLGYVGVDLVLGYDPSGRDDVAIEINPRPTTSYVGLRRAVDGNLAATLLAVAEGQDIAPPRAARTVDFTPSGDVVTC